MGLDLVTLAAAKSYTDSKMQSGVNIHPLTFTGAVEATYDGSEPVEVVIPQGWGSYGMRFLGKHELTEEGVEFSISKDADGNALSLRKFVILLYHQKAESTTKQTSYFVLRVGHSDDPVLLGYKADPYYCIGGECMADGRVLFDIAIASSLATYGFSKTGTRVHGVLPKNGDGKIHSIVLNTGTAAHIWAAGTYIEIYGE